MAKEAVVRSKTYQGCRVRWDQPVHLVQESSSSSRRGSGGRQHTTRMHSSFSIQLALMSYPC